MNNLCDCGLSQLGAKFLDTVGEKCKPPKFALATEIDRAIDLSCRACDACGAMAMGAGLGFPVGDSATLRFPPPTSDYKMIPASTPNKMLWISMPIMSRLPK